MAPLPVELRLLGAVLVLAIVNIAWGAQARTAQYGTRWNMGARDEQMPPLDPLPARLLRAQANLAETLPLFAAALLAAGLAGRFGPWTAAGSWLYAGGRIVYLPLYAMGVPVVRTLVWMVSMLGLVAVIVGLFLG